MRAHASRLSSAAPFAAAMLFCAPPGAEAGDAYCVTCKGPDQIYLCRVNGDVRSDAAKLYCVVRTAKEGGHASCSAREATAGCNGVEKIYSYDGPAIPDGLAEDPRFKKVLGRIEKEQKAFDKEDEHKSLVEVTGQAVSASRRGWRNMRASITGRNEANQASVPNPATPARSAAQDPLPELPGETPALPLSAAHAETVAPPPERKRGVGSIARNTYRCVRSLFRHCRSETAQTPN
ncbi:hypothetical protein [Methyloceanibacter sp.]|uniref:hypothetical protein n=1 Tax=Methyloceanibacter sp. TaxID=1965321 RepID=UPI003D6CF687